MVPLTAGHGGGADPVALPQEGRPPALRAPCSAPEPLSPGRLRCCSMTARTQSLCSRRIPRLFQALTAHDAWRLQPPVETAGLVKPPEGLPVPVTAGGCGSAGTGEGAAAAEMGAAASALLSLYPGRRGLSRGTSCSASVVQMPAPGQLLPEQGCSARLARAGRCSISRASSAVHPLSVHIRCTYAMMLLQ